MAVNQIFKTEFKGYNKAEVTEYIASLNAQLETLKSELETAENRLSKCQKELEEGAAPRELSTEELDAVKAEIRAQIEDEIRAELASQATAENDSEIAQLRQKAEMYDDQREILAELMIKAKSDATQITLDAQQSAAALLSDTFDKFLKLRSDFDEMKNNIMASKTELDNRVNNITHYLNDFAQYLEFIDRDIENTGDNFKQNM